MLGKSGKVPVMEVVVMRMVVAVVSVVGNKIGMLKQIEGGAQLDNDIA